MPIYEFVCEGCAASFEKRVPSSTSRVQCPHCKSRKVERQFSTFAFKGERGFVGSRGSSCGNCSSGG
jgi:putative FmdB family regulatory protein